MNEFLNVLFGGGLVSLLTFLIQRHDSRKDKFEEISNAINDLHGKIDALEKREEEKEVLNARNRILRFDDELRNKQKHSLEYFREILRDVDEYELYCAHNDDFKNSYATEAIANIRRVFRECKEQNSFV